MKLLFKKHQTLIVIIILIGISLSSFIYFSINNQLLLYGDALSRLNISRKIIDNLTPGLAQLGNVWLPLPQLLMLLFIWNDTMWQTGIAGSIISMTAFIIGGIFLYKTAYLLSKSFAASIFALSIYALNINLLYYQTTAMSETLFLSSVLAATYFFVYWIHFKKLYFLMVAGISVSAATLIRYEALALLIASIPIVFYYSWVFKKSYHKAEGNVIMYTMLASLGFAMWTLYLTVIFGDPLYWKNYYAGTRVVERSSQFVQGYVFGLNIFQAAWKYVTSVVWMNGIIPTIFALIGTFVLVIESIRKKTYNFLPFLLLLSMFAFMVLTIQRNTPINQPELTIGNILSPKSHYFLEFNIRYGLIMLPYISLISVYLFRSKVFIIKILLFLCMFVQYYTYLRPEYTLIYQIPVNIADNTTQGTPKEKALTRWLRDNYDGGLIMISALKHDPQMLQLGLPYKTYIHEGTGKYWKESRTNPQNYATWIVFDSLNKEDQVTRYVSKSNTLKQYFNLVYNKDGIKVYKAINKPLKDI